MAEVRLCPGCGEENPPEAFVCSNCGIVIAYEPLRGLGSVAAEVSAEATRREPEGSVGGSDEERTRREGGPEGRWVSRNLPPDLAERLKVEDELGSGGEATLLRVRSRTGAEQFVVKLYNRQIRPKPEVLARIRESGPKEHVVAVHEHGEFQGFHWELLEFCSLGSLADFMRLHPGGMPLPLVREMLKELAAGIAALHGINIVHRDLKPTNVLLRSRDPLDLVFADYGASSLLEGTIHYTGLRGTPAYMAPETMFESEAAVSRAADYWSLGMIFFEALVGELPFGGNRSAQSIVQQLVQRGIDVGPIEDPRWRLLCRGLLQRDPQRRWGASEVGRWLELYEQGFEVMEGDETLEAPEDGETQEFRPDSRRAKNPLVIAGVRCFDAREAAAAMASHWNEAQKTVARGHLGRWLKEELRDYELMAAHDDVDERRDLNGEAKVFLLVHLLEPERPPTFRGRALDLEEGLPRLAAEAVEGQAEALEVVQALADSNALVEYGRLTDSRQPWLRLGQSWAQALTAYWVLARQMPERFRGQLQEINSHAALLAAVAVEDAQDALRREAEAVLTPAARSCGWFFGPLEAWLGERPRDLPETLAALLVATVLAPQVATEVEAANRAREEARLAAEQAKWAEREARIRERSALQEARIRERSALHFQAVGRAALGGLVGAVAGGLLIHGCTSGQPSVSAGWLLFFLLLWPLRKMLAELFEPGDPGALLGGCIILLVVGAVSAILGTLSGFLLKEPLAQTAALWTELGDTRLVHGFVWVLPFALLGAAVAITRMRNGASAAWQFRTALGAILALVLALGDWHLLRMAFFPAERSVGGAATPVSPAVPHAPVIGIVREDGSRVRVLPYLQAGILRTLPRGTRLEILGERGEWSEVRTTTKSGYGWIHTSLLARESRGPSTKEPAPGAGSSGQSSHSGASDVGKAQILPRGSEVEAAQEVTWLFERTRYDEALRACDEALRQYPESDALRRLRRRIVETKRILE